MRKKKVVKLMWAKPFRIHIEIPLDELLGIQITSDDSE